MKYWYQKPHSDLADHVRTVLVVEGFSEADPAKVPLFTRGMPAFVCKTLGTSVPELNAQLSLYGQATPDECWIADNSTTVIAYFFKPFSLASVFDLSAAKLKEGPFDLGNWSPHKANALRTQLFYASSTEAKLDALDTLLRFALRDNKRNCEIISKATDQIMENSNPEVLSELLKRLGLTERTFQRIFKKYVGVTPNQYRRICQFQLSFSQLRAKEFDALADIAYDNGFADQSHFIRSFKEFTEITPKDYLRSGLKKNK
jgi:AraC-like DNA-binding protein